MLIKKVCTSFFPLAGILLINLEGRRCPQAPREKPKGQGLQVPSHSHRVPYPPSLSLLQDRRCSATHLEIRERHRQHHGRINFTTGHDGYYLAWSWGVGNLHG